MAKRSQGLMVEQILNLVKSSNLLPVEAAAALLLPSIRIHTQPVNEDELTLGTSKIGGFPDLPLDVEWPQVEVPSYLNRRDPAFGSFIERLPFPFITAQDIPHTFGYKHDAGFLCQFSLEELAPYDIQHVFPQEGLLLFFYDELLDTWMNYAAMGGIPNDGRAWKIIYVDGEKRNSGLKRVTTPIIQHLSGERSIAPRALSFHLEWMLPSADSPLLAEYQRPLFDPFAYLSLLEQIEAKQPEAIDPRGCFHRLLGHNQPVQNDVIAELSFLLPDIPLEEWRVLLQLSWDPTAKDMSWGDAGSLFFALRKTDLSARQFEATYGIKQQH